MPHKLSQTFKLFAVQQAGVCKQLLLTGWLLTLFAITTATAQPAYVIDTLWLGVKQNRDDDAITVKIIHSGEPVELVKIIDGQAKISTSDGTPGWIDASYLTESLPISSELEKAQQSIDNNLARVVELEKQIKQLREIGQPYDPAQQQMKQNLRLLSSCAIIAGLCFWAGVRWHRYRVQKRLGGLLP